MFLKIILLDIVIFFNHKKFNLNFVIINKINNKIITKMIGKKTKYVIFIELKKILNLFVTI